MRRVAAGCGAGRQWRARYSARTFRMSSPSRLTRIADHRQAGRAARLGYADPFRSRRRVGDCAGRSFDAAEGWRTPESLRPQPDKMHLFDSSERPGVAVRRLGPYGQITQRWRTSHPARGRVARDMPRPLRARPDLAGSSGSSPGGSEKIKSLEYHHARRRHGRQRCRHRRAARRSRPRSGGGVAKTPPGHEMRDALSSSKASTSSNFRLFPDGRSSVSGILVDSSGERQIVNFRGVLSGGGRLAAAR